MRGLQLRQGKPLPGITGIYIARKRLDGNVYSYLHIVNTAAYCNHRSCGLVEFYIDLYICSYGNDFENVIDNHALIVQRWKAASRDRVRESILKKHREKQFKAAIDDEHEFVFELYRNNTRYTQKNYVKTAYKVSMTDRSVRVDADWLLERYKQLRAIGFETDLNSYHNKNQRKQMTKKLRLKIMERDNYTCQNCGKYMPDRVGLQIDHIVPVARGGKSVESNLQVLCSRCNGSKGVKEPDAFY